MDVFEQVVLRSRVSVTIRYVCIAYLAPDAFTISATRLALKNSILRRGAKSCHVNFSP